MPRFIIERTFKDGLTVPISDEGAEACRGIVVKNGGAGVTWVHSYVSKDHKKTYCVYDGPDEKAIRQAAERNGLPVDAVSEVSVLDPYFYR
ncbi:MAG: DUF4242 domain-containing protein [Candidatus Eremiobacteraeota bacterium]|nr:DUF4242 domain-containing protein [Candidatus Eremiobacteraeota bacterium]MBC5828166.1 DUF4242 domain-containing protein [Candidatus Eremiobacteraeota bacterium]